jgi:16S rRNA (cytosine967-C5)-methyltransferase
VSGPRRPRSGRPVTPARAVAFAVVRRTFEQGAYTDQALHAEAARAGLAGRELAFATRLAYGTVQRAGTLDHLLAILARRPAGRLDPPVRAAARLGLYQLLWLGGVADHAAVSESVELVRGHPGAGLVNAVLRRAAREGRALVDALDDRSPADAAVAHSVPGWLARMWWDELGAEDARALLATVNAPAEGALRANTLVGTAAELRAALAVRGVPARAAPGLPDGLVLGGPFDAHGSGLFAAGAFMPQSRGSMAVAHAAAPPAGVRILDLCAAPGAKATHLAALAGPVSEVVAVERHGGRAAAMARTAARLHAATVRVETGDAAAPRADGPFDLVVLDPPCSGLGTLQSRPDLRWKASPEGVRTLAGAQSRLLAAAADAVRPGGVLVYSVCTISRREGAGQIAALRAARSEFRPDPVPTDDPVWQDWRVGDHFELLPHRHGTDGFFIARLRRAA